jgi:hypothetical protein
MEGAISHQITDVSERYFTRDGASRYIAML